VCKKMTGSFNGRLGLVQRVLPTYRVPFFDALAASCASGMSLFTGLPRADEAIATTSKLQIASYTSAQNLHFGSPASPLYFCYQRGLTGWLAAWDPDALIVEANFRYLSTPAAIRWMQRRGRPVIGWGLGAPAGRGLLSGVRQRFLRRFDGIIAYSKRGAQQYAACGIPAERIFVAPNAVAPAPKHDLPVRADPPGAQPVILFVGRLQARKRIPALLKACSEMPGQLRPRLVIVGDGPELDNLRTLARGLYPPAEFVGAKHGQELAAYFSTADLFVLPGTGGLAVQEAMSYGLPVIVAQGDGTQDDLVRPLTGTRPANGWLISPDDDAALAAALREALSDVGRLRLLGKESYRIVREEINVEKMVAVFVEALNSVKRG
jgi:glycosyltransferase involved in cell wall biosynthesis